MTNQELLTKAKKFQRGAKHVVDSLGILKTLSRVGEPKIVGSAKNGLMVSPDIDVHVSMKKVALKKVVALLPIFAMLPTIQKVQFNNYRELRRDYRRDRINFPRGYYIGLRTLQPSGEWKIDIWFGERGMFGDFDEGELARLTDTERLLILRLKEELKTEKGYLAGIVSTDFYKAVLHHKVKTRDVFSLYGVKRIGYSLVWSCFALAPAK